ncbi:MAG: glycosyltransferase family 2 protein [Candidatus Aenigmatarchaeota archaeon]
MLEIFVIFLILLIDATYLTILISINLPQKKILIKKLPRVSVIIAAKEGHTLEHTLRVLKTVKKPEIELIVATHDKETARIARRYTKKIVVDRGIGKGSALNMAVKKASSSILYFLDEDSIVQKGTIEKVCSALGDCEISTGINIPNGKGLVAIIARLYVSTLNMLWRGIYNLIGTTVVTGRNFAIYKNTLKKAGNFRNMFTEDLDLSFRLFMRHKKIGYVNVVCSEQAPYKLSQYTKQQQRWNAGSAQVLGEWEKRLHHHDIALLLFLILMAFVAPLSMLFLVLAIFFKSYLFLSVTLLGFLVCLSSVLKLERKDMMMFPLTFFIFIALHSFLLVYTAFNKPKGWYRTPKK